MGGVFTPERYRLELTFAGSITFSLFFIICGETLTREAFKYKRNKSIYALATLLAFASLFAILAISLISVYGSYLFMAIEPMHRSSGIGVGNLIRIFKFNDIPSLLIDLISLSTFIFLIYVLKTYPSLQKKIEKIPPSA